MRTLFSRRRVRYVAAVAFACAIVAAWTWWRMPSPLVADFLDVGQGDAELLRVGREEMLIDGGPDATVLAGLGESLPLLDRRIETVILTHAHADHLVGLVHVLKRYEVGRLYYTGAGETPEWLALVAAAKARGVPMHRLAAGQELTLGDRRVAVLWPPEGCQPPKGDENYRSAVLCVRAADGCDLLLTGDAPSGVEAELLKTGTVPRALVLKVGHHGSRSSTSSAFLAAVRPAVAVVEVGKNSYGHPAWATLQRLKKTGARLYKTVTDGHIRLTFSHVGTPRAATGTLASWPPVR